MKYRLTLIEGKNDISFVFDGESYPRAMDFLRTALEYFERREVEGRRLEIAAEIEPATDVF